MRPTRSSTPAGCPWEIQPLRNLVDVIPSGIYGAEVSGGTLLPMPVATTAHIDEDDSWNDKEMTVRFFTEAQIARYAPEEGDLVVVKSSGSAASIQSGKIAFVSRGKAGSFMFSNFLMLLRPTGCDERFLFYQLTSGRVKRMLPQLVEASTYPNLRLNDYLEIEVPLPSEEEQRAIAAALSNMDELLGALEALIAKKRAIKQAAVQQLLTGKTRLPGFSGEWETKRIGDLANIDPENLAESTDPEYAFNYISLEQVDHGTLVGWSEETFISSPSRARRVVRTGDVLVATVRPNLRSHLLYDGLPERAVCSTGFAVVRCKANNAIPAFVYAHFFASSINEQIERILAGSNYPAINRSDVARLEIKCPDVPEQAAIAAVLSDMDAEIAALEARRDKTCAIKHGMMQQLLMGRVRLMKAASAEVA